MQPGAAAPFIKAQKYDRRHGIVDGIGYGEPTHILAQDQKQHLIGGNDQIPNRCGDRGIFRLQVALEPVSDGVKRLKNQGHAVKRHHRQGQALSPVHNGHNGDNGHCGQCAGQQPHGDGGAHCRPGILRVLHEVLQKKRTQSQGSKGCEKGGIQSGIVDEAIVAGPQIARGEQIDQKGQRHMDHPARHEPSGIFCRALGKERGYHDICSCRGSCVAARSFQIGFRGQVPG